MMYWDDHGMTGWGTGLMIVSMLLFLALLAVGAFALVRYLGRPGLVARNGHRPTPEQLLAERFARGEIEPDEYRSRLATLRGGGGPPATG